MVTFVFSPCILNVYSDGLPSPRTAAPSSINSSNTTSTLSYPNSCPTPIQLLGHPLVPSTSPSTPPLPILRPSCSPTPRWPSLQLSCTAPSPLPHENPSDFSSYGKTGLVLLRRLRADFCFLESRLFCSLSKGIGSSKKPR